LITVFGGGKMFISFQQKLVNKYYELLKERRELNFGKFDFQYENSYKAKAILEKKIKRQEVLCKIFVHNIVWRVK